MHTYLGGTRLVTVIHVNMVCGKVYRCSSRVFSIVSTKFHVNQEKRFSYEFSVEELLVLLSLCGYLGEIESGKKNPCAELFVYMLFLLSLRNLVSGSARPIFKS